MSKTPKEPLKTWEHMQSENAGSLSLMPPGKVPVTQPTQKPPDPSAFRGEAGPDS